MSDTTELVDPQGLERFLRDRLPELSGPFEVERLGEGQSCLTFSVRGDGWDVVLRRPPRGDLPPTAFDVSREYRVTRALFDSGAPVPVARPIALCESRDVIGAPFYLMERVRGHVVRATVPPALDAMDDRARMCEQLVDTLVALREVDWRRAGLDGFGKPDGYLERQLRRMRQLWELAKFREIPEIDDVGAWLESRVPASPPPAIVHGDYKLDNVIFAPESPARLVAVVDWEMSTIGDPLADLGWMMYFWRDPGDDGFGLAVSAAMNQDGFLRRREILARYAKSADVPDHLRWYCALAGWKIAIIMEGSYRRFMAGIADHPLFAQLEQGVLFLARRAAQAANGELGF